MSETIKWGRYHVQFPAVAKGNRYVFRGYDPILHKEVAIKIYKNILRGYREADIMNSYGSHPHLPTFYEYFVNNDRGHLVMEYVDGDRLNHLPKGLARAPSVAVEITLSVLDGLKHLHDNGILHFDIAHHNILINDDNPATLKIIDLCSSVIKNADGVWLSKRSGGTVNFLPPEQKKAPVILYPSSDLYSVSRLCYWLISRSFPMAGQPPQLKDKLLNKILLKGMKKDPNKRYQTAGEFINALKYWQSKVKY